ncbi:stage II sporulation protein M [Natronospora cellulosivora (SeqCode)]
MMNKFIRDRFPYFVFVIIVFIVGISFGTIAIRTIEYSVRENIFSYFNDFIQGFDTIQFDRTTFITDSLRFNLLNLFVIWSFGLSMVLMPLITIVVFLKGFVLGFTVSFLLSEYGFTGILIALAAVLPQNLIIIPVFILSSVMSIYMGLRIFGYYRGRNTVSFEEITTFSIEILILAVIMSMASLIETFISPFLLSLLFRFI